MYTSIEEAQTMLQEVEVSVAAEMGEEAAEAGWHDILHSVAASCTPEVAKELLRRNS